MKAISASYICMRAKSLQSYRTLCGPLDCSPAGSSDWFLQARIMEWVAITSPPENLPDPGIKPKYLMLLSLAGGFFTTSTTGEAHFMYNNIY